MTEESSIDLSTIAEINPTYIFRWEEAEQAFLLLYPEGIVKLNTSAGHILKHCDGIRSLKAIVDELEKEFEQTDLDQDVLKFMEVANDKDWIRIKG
jgi:pyrroloquinoline quinone biosynthesis protein D